MILAAFGGWDCVGGGLVLLEAISMSQLWEIEAGVTQDSHRA